MDFTWTKIRSWHAVDPEHEVRTLCGRFATSTQAEVPPAAEKTCESCLRISMRRAER